MRKPHLGFVIFYGNGQGLFGSYQDHQLLCPCNTSIDQISLKEEVMLGHDRKDYGRILASLGFVNRNGIGQDNFIEFRKVVIDLFPVKLDGQLPVFPVDPGYPSDVTSMTSRVSRANFLTILSAMMGPMPLINPEPRYFLMP